jgi:pimeloyl-ACP methyl ester carboxylesterase
MARHGLRRRDDGRFTAKLDPAFRTRRTGSPEEMDAWMAQQERALWEALERIACPTLVVRGAASDVLSPETADRMVEEVLAQGRLEVIPRAGHSVMTDNPDAFDAALCRFVLGEG